MSIWNTLGIEPTRDKREIKRAYAKMAARYHPEEQPEKFQEIYDAYEQALSHAEGYAGTAFLYEEVIYKEESGSEPEVSFGNDASVQKSEMSMPINEENSIDFDGKIPQTPRQRIVQKDNTEEYQIDFEKLTPDSGRKLMLKPLTEQTINFQSIVKEEPPDEPQYHAEPEEHIKKKKKMGLQDVLKLIVVIGTWCFIWGLLHQFTDGDLDDSLGFKRNLSGLERVKHTLEEQYDDEFYVSSIDIPDTLDRIYYLVADGKVKEDYQWFYCSKNDGTLMVQFYAALDDSGVISYNYSYKELLAFIDYVGLGNYLDVLGIQKNNLEYMEKGEKRYCYPILKLSSGNLNEDFFQRIEQLADMIQESKAQFYNSEQLTINIKNSNSGAVYNLHIKKGKDTDMETIKQELTAFFER